VRSTGYVRALEAQRYISHYLMHPNKWFRPHQFNDGLPPAVAVEKLNPLSAMG
ncbi:IS3 family transposase, partial [Pseudomonas aeruginosa]